MCSPPPAVTARRRRRSTRRWASTSARATSLPRSGHAPRSPRTAERSEEAQQLAAVEPEPDHLRARVDRLDRCGRDDEVAPQEAPGADRERIRLVRTRAVHRRLDAADDPPADIRDEEADGLVDRHRARYAAGRRDAPARRAPPASPGGHARGGTRSS